MVPKFLYKFEKINVQVLRNLKNAQLFFNTPSSFNDPFDCAVIEASVMLKESDYINIFNMKLKEDYHLSGAKISRFSDIPQNFRANLLKGIQNALKKQEKKALFERGCTCFSERKDHILMWSHYADNHRGLCFEFNTSFEPFNEVRKVEYSDTFPSIEPMSLISDDQQSDEEVLLPLLTKFKCWDYEREWRAFHNEPKKLLTYEVDALNAVYFGCAVDDTDIENVCLILKGQSKNIKFYKARKDGSKYQLHFDEFDYKSYLEHTESIDWVSNE